MTPDQVSAALKKTEGEIIGLLKSGRRKYGTAPFALGSQWPASALGALEVLKRQAKEYRRMLEPAEKELIS